MKVKRHRHPKPHQTLHDFEKKNGQWTVEVGRRIYTLHPTKGWRCWSRR